MKHIIPSGDPVPKFKDFKGAIKSAGSDKNGMILLVSIILIAIILIRFLITGNLSYDLR